MNETKTIHTDFRRLIIEGAIPPRINLRTKGDGAAAYLLLITVFCLLVFILVCQTAPACAGLTQAAGAGGDSSQPAARDGSHDFDFNAGVWHTEIRRTPEPFADPSNSYMLSGTVTVNKVWGGRAQLEEIEADGPKGHWEGLTLFLYNPESHQWSQSFINSKIGVLGSGLVGEFHDGRAELYSPDTFHDKAILVHGEWFEITPNSHRYRESYSQDGGKTWATSLDAHLTRVEDPPSSDIAAGAEPMSGDVDAHAFDFDLGTWKSHSSRLMHPLSGSTDWADLDGTTVVSRVWGGRANLAEYVGNGPAGHVELLALRWFNPNTHEWNLDFATPNVGMLGIPGVAKCKDGRCDFYDQEQIKGRYTLVRFSIWKISDDTAQSEQAFSLDGGQTWETNWVNKYTRVKGS